MGVNLGDTEDSLVKDFEWSVMKSQIQFASIVITHPSDCKGPGMGMDDGQHC
jgi:hypothetical protein